VVSLFDVEGQVGACLDVRVVALAAGATDEVRQVPLDVALLTLRHTLIGIEVGVDLQRFVEGVTQVSECRVLTTEPWLGVRDATLRDVAVGVGWHGFVAVVGVGWEAVLWATGSRGSSRGATSGIWHLWPTHATLASLHGNGVLSRVRSYLPDQVVMTRQLGRFIARWPAFFFA